MFKTINIITNVSMFLLALVILPSDINAQALDENVFDQIIKQTGGSNQTTTVQSPLDQLRAQDYMNKLDLQLMEKREAGPSVIEKSYNDRQIILGGDDATVSQFGYDLFDRLPMPDNMTTGSIPDSYIVGVGDEFVISFKGSKEEVIVSKVDREGRLVVPSLEPLMVTNLEFGAVKESLEKQVNESLIGTEIFVSMATLRQISVLVVGEVYNPSVIRTTSLSSPIEALLHVGGVKKTGSMRNITLHRGSQRIAIDLYDIVNGGN
ncbi:MAG: hypothetical protein P8J14_05895, partial [Emcibacteraceae bacterium]|nr:hypothetical protein [Emcibacteraceae bacterium]